MKKADVLFPQTANKMNSFRKRTGGKRRWSGWSRQEGGGVEACLRSGLIFRSAVCLGRRWKASLFLSAQEGHRAPLYRRDRGRRRQRGGQGALNNLAQLLVDLRLWSWSIPVGRLVFRSHWSAVPGSNCGLRWGEKTGVSSAASRLPRPPRWIYWRWNTSQRCVSPLSLIQQPAADERSRFWQRRRLFPSRKMTLSLFFEKSVNLSFHFPSVYLFSCQWWIQRATLSKKGLWEARLEIAPVHSCARTRAKEKKKVHHLHSGFNSENSARERNFYRRSVVTTWTRKKPWPAAQWLKVVAGRLQTEWWSNKSNRVL